MDVGRYFMMMDTAPIYASIERRSFPEWLDRVGLLLDAKLLSCADQNVRAKFVPWYAALAFGICELARQTKSPDFCNVARIVRTIWIESS